MTKGDNSEIHPRLCVLRITPEHQQYGFNIQVDDEKHAPTVSGLGENSAAQAGGLRIEDYIIEINGENVENLSHQEIDNRIRSSPEVLRVLVLNENDWNQAKDENIQINGNWPSIQIIDPLPGTQAVGPPTYPIFGNEYSPDMAAPYPGQPGNQNFDMDHTAYPLPPTPYYEYPTVPQNLMVVQEKPPPPTDYCLGSVCVCFFCCMAFGIAGMILSNAAKEKYKNGDIDGAYRKANKAKKMCIAGIILGIALIVGNIIRVYLS